MSISTERRGESEGKCLSCCFQGGERFPISQICWDDAVNLTRDEHLWKY